MSKLRLNLYPRRATEYLAKAIAELLKRGLNLLKVLKSTYSVSKQISERDEHSTIVQYVRVYNNSVRQETATSKTTSSVS